MKNIMKLFYRYLMLFIIGGGIYYFLEILWRSYSHFSMFILGGIVFLYCDIQNEFVSWDCPLYKQVLPILAFTLVGEFITGLIVNIWLKLNVWDYSNLPLNILGQVCVPFAMVFLPLCLFGIILDDYIRYYFFKESKPHYTFFKSISETPDYSDKTSLGIFKKKAR